MKPFAFRNLFNSNSCQPSNTHTIENKELHSQIPHNMVLVFPFFDPVASFNSNETSNIPETKPKFTISRTPTETQLSIELPGVTKEDTFVEVTGTNLKIFGRQYRKGGSTSSPEKKVVNCLYRLEVKLGRMVKKASISAELQAGVLFLTIPLNGTHPLTRNDFKVSIPELPVNKESPKDEDVSWPSMFLTAWWFDHWRYYRFRKRRENEDDLVRMKMVLRELLWLRSSLVCI